MSTWPVMSAAYAVRGSPAAPNGRCAISPVRRAREDRSPVLELVHVVGRLLAEDLDRVLVAEVVGALDGVERVLLRIVLGRVPERRVDAPLGRAGVAANRVDLRDHRDVRACVESLDRGTHARAARPDDDHVVHCVHRRTLPDRSSRPLLPNERGASARGGAHRHRARPLRAAAGAAPRAELPALRRRRGQADGSERREATPSSAAGT